jgi:hypothetical protein
MDVFWGRALPLPLPLLPLLNEAAAAAAVDGVPPAVSDSGPPLAAVPNGATRVFIIVT